MSKKTPVQTPLQNNSSEPVLSIRAQDTDQTAQDSAICARCVEYLDLAKRARADYDNLKKDTEKWKAEFVGYANENLLYDILPIMDNFLQAIVHIPESEKTEDWVIGITYIKKQLEDVLKKYGVMQYGAIGEMFDPHRFEAVEEVGDPKYAAGTIVKVIRYGYMLGARVLRTGQVVVGK